MDSQALEGCRILIAEDEVILALDMAETLSIEGAEILGPVSSVKGALAFLTSHPDIDAAVLDLNLDGELCYPIADELAALDIPFVICSSYEAVTELPQLRAVRTLIKPVTPKQLVEEVVSVVGDQAMHQASAVLGHPDS